MRVHIKAGRIWEDLPCKGDEKGYRPVFPSKSKTRLVISVQIIALTVDPPTKATSFGILWVSVMLTQTVFFCAKIHACHTLLTELTLIAGESHKSSFELPWVRCIAILRSFLDATFKCFVSHAAAAQHRWDFPQSDAKCQT